MNTLLPWCEASILWEELFVCDRTSKSPRVLSGFAVVSIPGLGVYLIMAGLVSQRRVYCHAHSFHKALMCHFASSCHETPRSSYIQSISARH